MDKYKELSAVDSAACRKAQEMLALRVSVTTEKQEEIVGRALLQGISDTLVHPTGMTFMKHSASPFVRLNYAHKTGLTTIHPHALRQMAGVAGFSITYLNSLTASGWSAEDDGDSWRLDLLAHNLNELFHKGTFLDRKKNVTKFLHRRVGDEVRGFLSRSYNRKLSTLNLLRPFIDTCKLYGAEPVEALSSDLRLNIKYMLPVIFEPIAGEYVAFGVTYTNSDFGAGRLRVSGSCLRIAAGTVIVMEDALVKVHLGSLIQEADLELSEETEDAELLTYQSAVRDTVRALLAPATVEKTLKLIQLAAEREIPWFKLRQTLSKVLNKLEVDAVRKLLDGESTEAVDLPPVHKVGENATAWWAANVLGWMATKTSDEDKKSALQALAGGLVAQE